MEMKFFPVTEVANAYAGKGFAPELASFMIGNSPIKSLRAARNWLVKQFQGDEASLQGKDVVRVAALPGPRDLRLKEIDDRRTRCVVCGRPASRYIVIGEEGLPGGPVHRHGLGAPVCHSTVEPHPCLPGAAAAALEVWAAATVL